MPSIGRHSQIANTVALWQLDQSLADASGVSGALTLQTGITQYGPIYPRGPMGLYLAAARYVNANAALRITGNLTVALIATLADGGSAIRYLFSYSGTIATETAPHNHLYSLYLSTTTANAFKYLSESGAGVDYDQNFFPLVGMLSGSLYHIVLRRTGTTIELWINGLLYGSLLGATAPTDGSSGSFYLGSSQGTSHWAGTIASVMVVSRAVTDPEIQAMYEETVGRMYLTRV
jgi:Concanavalin A-like lectin/glucanases superfamily